MTDEPKPDFEGEEPADPEFGPDWDDVAEAERLGEPVDDEPAAEPAPNKAPNADRFPAVAEYDHEERLLGALLLAGADGHDVAGRVVVKVRATGLGREHFSKPLMNGSVFVAALALADAGHPCELLLVRDELQRRSDLERAGGEMRLRELAAAANTYANATFHAEAILNGWRRREQVSALQAALQAAQNGGLEANENVRERLRIVVTEAVRPAGQHGACLVDGATFIAGGAAEVASVWGRGDAIAWAVGEALMLFGPQGVGKSTIGQQLALGRIGMPGRSSLLGMDLLADKRPVLYVAADRPRQIERSLRRMVRNEHFPLLREMLRVHKGPLPFLLNNAPDELAAYAVHVGAGTVILDSLKDLAVDLASDESGARVNRAVQRVLAAEIELVTLHHPRKATDSNKRPDKLDDVYGSTFLTGGHGSVILLWGKAGDPLVEFRHLKQPVEEIGPFTVRHDHDQGRATRQDRVDLVTLLRDRGADGVTVEDAAKALYAVATPAANDLEKARRQLEKLLTQRLAEKQPVPGSSAVRYLLNAGKQEEIQP